jgi:hypothetical protein
MPERWVGLIGIFLSRKRDRAKSRNSGELDKRVVEVGDRKRDDRNMEDKNMGIGGCFGARMNVADFSVRMDVMPKLLVPSAHR